MLIKHDRQDPINFNIMGVLVHTTLCKTARQAITTFIHGSSRWRNLARVINTASICSSAYTYKKGTLACGQADGNNSTQQAREHELKLPLSKSTTSHDRAPQIHPVLIHKYVETEFKERLGRICGVVQQRCVAMFIHKSINKQLRCSPRKVWSISKMKLLSLGIFQNRIRSS